MNAPTVLRDRVLWDVLGTPGADNQVQVNVQVLTGVIDAHLNPQRACKSFFFCSTPMSTVAGSEAMVANPMRAKALFVEGGYGASGFAIRTIWPR